MAPTSSSSGQRCSPPWQQKKLVRQPDLAGELYLPTLCPIAGEHFPAMVILPDDSGISDARERAYADYFASKGITCLIVDPFSVKGIAHCRDNLRQISTREMMLAAYNAYAMLIQWREIKSVGVLGIGRGGLAALHLGMTAMPGMPHFTGRFDFIISLSPAAYIQLRAPQPTGAPILMITAGQDDIMDARAAVRYAGRIKAASLKTSVSVIRLPQAAHAWENAGKPQKYSDAVVHPKNVYYLENTGTYTDAPGECTWMPFEVIDHMSTNSTIGGHIGGGDAQRFASTCQTIGTFILKNHVVGRAGMNVDLQMLNRMDARDDLLLSMARCRNLDEIFSLVSSTFGNLPDTALVRIWLAEPPNGACDGCAFTTECTDRSRCLHLVASSGYSIISEEEWTNTEGKFQHFPFGVHKVGVIAATGTPFHVHNVSPDMPWIANPEWIAREKIRTFLGQPLICENEAIGVLIIFSRGDHAEEVMVGLRMVADHIAVKIAHARAFEELGRLKRQLEIENHYLQSTADTCFLPGLIGESSAIRHVKEQILHVAPTDALVLITGESGTGKELVANELHAMSHVSLGPLVKVNCPTIPHELFESEFFGHVRGAFTGANTNHIGFFEAAEHGTLFLDEIGELAISQQSKLLRALQENEYRRVGEENVRKFHTRVIAATNRDPRSMVAAGTLREDLFYRLNVFPIHIPPLRERREDIPLLVTYFLKKFAEQLNRPGLRLAEGQTSRLMGYNWPGNIRELQNVLNRGAILARGNRISMDFFDAPISSSEADRHPVEIASSLTAPTSKPAPTNTGIVPDERILDRVGMHEFERQNIIRALQRCNGKIFGHRGAAELLGIRPTTLIARLNKLGIDRGNLQ